MPELKLLSGRRRRSGPPPELKPISVLERRRGPGWVAIARHYEHEFGPFKIWTVAVADQGDVICAQKLFDWLRFWYERDRILAREKAEKRRQQRARRKARVEQPPAEPQGGGLGPMDCARP